MINLPGSNVLPRGVAKIFQIEKNQRFDKSDTDISDLIEMKVVSFLHILDMSFYAVRAIYAVNFVSLFFVPPKNLFLPGYRSRECYGLPVVSVQGFHLAMRKILPIHYDQYP